MTLHGDCGKCREPVGAPPTLTAREVAALFQQPDEGFRSSRGGGSGGHDDGECDVAFGDVSAQVGRLATVDRADEHHARDQLGAQREGLAKC